MLIFQKRGKQNLLRINGNPMENAVGKLIDACQPAQVEVIAQVLPIGHSSAA